MARHQRSWTHYGNGRLSERRIFGIWFFHECLGQQWSPVCNDLRNFYGMRVGRWRLGFDVASVAWTDGKEPTSERRLMP